MIISRTPFRISLAGGGSDFAEYYRAKGGRVVTMAINRYMHVTVNRRFDDGIRVSYTKTEIVNHIDELQHDLIREAMKMVGITSGVEITTIADLPAGIGLGSSSTLTVGVLNALYSMKGEWRSADELAKRACEIEIDVLKHPIGKQDQYIAAFGGLCDVYFRTDDSVAVHPLVCPPERRDRLVAGLMLFYTGVTRSAGSVLQEARQRAGTNSGKETVDGLVDIAARMRTAVDEGDHNGVGCLLDESWVLKKQMASNVSNDFLDSVYDRARAAGALGGKVSGAGGGGCFLLCVAPNRREAVRQAMVEAGLKEIPFRLEPEGARIIYYGM